MGKVLVKIEILTLASGNSFNILYRNAKEQPKMWNDWKTKSSKNSNISKFMANDQVLQYFHIAKKIRYSEISTSEILGIMIE